VKRWVKILLIVVVVLVVVVAAAAVSIFGVHTFIGPRKRELTNRTFERTPARLERGKYLVNGMGCG
jgi:flagellar basal body-associated protein FliL